MWFPVQTPWWLWVKETQKWGILSCIFKCQCLTTILSDTLYVDIWKIAVYVVILCCRIAVYMSSYCEHIHENWILIEVEIDVETWTCSLHVKLIWKCSVKSSLETSGSKIWGIQTLVRLSAHNQNVFFSISFLLDEFLKVHSHLIN